MALGITVYVHAPSADHPNPRHTYSSPTNLVIVCRSSAHLIINNEHQENLLETGEGGYRSLFCLYLVPTKIRRTPVSICLARYSSKPRTGIWLIYDQVASSVDGKLNTFSRDRCSQNGPYQFLSVYSRQTQPGYFRPSLLSPESFVDECRLSPSVHALLVYLRQYPITSYTSTSLPLGFFMVTRLKPRLAYGQGGSPLRGSSLKVWGLC